MKIRCERCGRKFRVKISQTEAFCPECGMRYLFEDDDKGESGDDLRWIDRIEEYDAMMDDYDGEGWF